MIDHSIRWPAWLWYPFVAVCVALSPATARALDYHWANASGGWFDIDSNWNPVGEPGVNDSAIFDLYDTYEVDFWDNHTNRYFTHDNGYVTFDLNGHSYTVTSSTLLGYDSNDYGQLIVQDGSISSASVYIGYSDNAMDHLKITTGGAWSSSGYFYIGYTDETSGSLTIEENGSISAVGMYIGSYDQARGTVYLTGATAQVSLSGSQRWVSSPRQSDGQ